MKILTSRIKKWSFKQRLFEIRQRLRSVESEIIRSDKAGADVRSDMDEIMQILDYWMSNMAGQVEKPPKKKHTKPVNLW